MALRLCHPDFPIRCKITLESIDELIGAECERACDAAVDLSPALEVLAQYRGQVRVDSPAEAVAVLVATVLSTYPQTHPRTAQRLVRVLEPVTRDAPEKLFARCGATLAAVRLEARRVLAFEPPDPPAGRLRVVG